MIRPTCGIFTAIAISAIFSDATPVRSLGSFLQRAGTEDFPRVWRYRQWVLTHFGVGRCTSISFASCERCVSLAHQIFPPHKYRTALRSVARVCDGATDPPCSWRARGRHGIAQMERASRLLLGSDRGFKSLPVAAFEFVIGPRSPSQDSGALSFRSVPYRPNWGKPVRSVSCNMHTEWVASQRKHKHRLR